ncbi:MAG: dTMP kinase [Candidatus Melainabacteria bacterium GWF2_37_15]|nr:MAG: dTMP kinase [Candidatus Melainabacteria bacterium GWF2_37_15]
MVKKGLFITFEGIDGCGKSSQIDLAAEYLKAQGIDFIKTRDPGGTPLGCKIREILLNYDGHVAPMCELFLYLADRAQHIEEKILPALNEGKIVLCDRYVDSTIAYQGYARGLDKEQILELNNIVAKGLMPDLTFVFDVSLEVSASRLGDKKDRMESECCEFHKKVREGYLDLAKKFPERIKVINADRGIEEIHKNVVDIVCDLYK